MFSHDAALKLYKKNYICQCFLCFEQENYRNYSRLRYLDLAYLDAITYVEPISKSQIFSLYIYCISTPHVSN